MPNPRNRWTAAGLHHLLGLLYPPQCCWCDMAVPYDRRLCETCRPLFLSDYYRCQRCAAPLPHVLPNVDCSRCRSAKWKFSRVVALGPYRAELREAVILIKKPRFELLRHALGGLLGELLLKLPELQSVEAPANSRAAIPAVSPSDLADSVHHAPPPAAARVPQPETLSPAAMSQPKVSQVPLLIPVPNYWDHAWHGAANTAASLAYAVAGKTGWPVAVGSIRRIRKTAKQGMLSWAERKRNVRHAFKIRRPDPLIGRHVMLVDDVLTSGATAAELSRLLLRSGAQRVTVVVAARGTGTRDTAPEAPATG